MSLIAIEEEQLTISYAGSDDRLCADGENDSDNGYGSGML